MSRLFIFDMDGTLLPGTTASLEVARATSTNSELKRLEELFIKGEIDTKGFATEALGLWGQLDRGLIQSIFQACPKLKNIRETIAAICNQQGHQSILITMSSSFFANEFNEFGFDQVFSSHYPSSHGEKLDLDKVLTPKDKPEIAQGFCREKGLDFTKSVAFGDSISDHFLFDLLSETVAVNASDELKSRSKYQYDGDCLREAVQLGSWI